MLLQSNSCTQISLENSVYGWMCGDYPNRIYLIPMFYWPNPHLCWWFTSVCWLQNRCDLGSNCGFHSNLCWFYVFILVGKNRNFQFFFLKFQIFVADIAIFRFASQLSSFAGLQDIHLQLPGGLEAEQGADEADGALPKAGSCRKGMEIWWDFFARILAFRTLATSRRVVIKNRHPSGVFKAPKAINGQHQDPQNSKNPPELGWSVVDLFMNWEKNNIGSM